VLNPKDIEFQDIPAYVKEMQIILTGSLINEAKKQVLTLENVIRRMKQSGMAEEEIKNILLTDLQEGGVIFGDFRKAFKATVKNGIEDSARKEIEQKFKTEVELFDCLGIVDGSICSGCLDRHNEPPNTWQYWERRGLPGAGATPCDKNCRCIVLPTGEIEKEKGGLIR